MNELSRRVLFAIIAAPLFITVVWLGGWYFIALIAVVSLLIQREMGMLMHQMGYRPSTLITYLGGLAILSISFLDYAAVLLFGLLLLFVGYETVSRENRSMYRLMSTLYCSVYAPACLLALLLIRNQFGDEMGLLLTVLVVFMIWGNDVFAYFGGKSFGRYLLAPHLSPKKTWEGFFSGFLGAGIAYWLIVNIFPEVAFTTWQSICLIVLVSLFGPLGDLAASKIKRAAGTKDSSDILPGHGGFLDRFDSLLFAAPAVYIFLLFVL